MVNAGDSTTEHFTITRTTIKPEIYYDM